MRERSATLQHTNDVELLMLQAKTVRHLNKLRAQYNRQEPDVAVSDARVQQLDTSRTDCIACNTDACSAE